MNCKKLVFPEKWFSVREKVFGKSYSLENSLRELIFREDILLYNCLQGPQESEARWNSLDDMREEEWNRKSVRTSHHMGIQYVELIEPL